MPSRTLGAAAASLLAVGAAQAAAGQETAPSQGRQTVHYDYVDDFGVLRGGKVAIRPGPGLPAGARPAPSDVRMLFGDEGPTNNRIDIVLVGDGYTSDGQVVAQKQMVIPEEDFVSDDIRLFRLHSGRVAAELLNLEPFATYRRVIKIHSVEVISPQRGVDHDPNFGIYRDTRLDMGFWTDGIERLLGVNTAKANLYAALAPDVDIVVAIANSTKYGGAGYQSQNVVTVSGGEFDSFDITLHELGHVIGLMADEYQDGAPDLYTGAEPVEPNLSTQTAQQMAQTGLKWAPWLGEVVPGLDGPVGTFQGAILGNMGVYRPSPNSIMRTLGRPFHPPGMESMVIGLYRTIDPIDAGTTPGTVPGDAVLFVDPIDPFTHALDIQWFVDGLPVSGGNGEQLDLGALVLPPGSHLVKVKVVDNTPMVRNTLLRSLFLTEEREWTAVVGAAAPPPFDVETLGRLLGDFGRTGDGLASDYDGDGTVGMSDLNLLLSGVARAR